MTLDIYKIYSALILANISKREYYASLMLGIHETTVEVYAFLLLHYEPHQSIEYMQLTQHFATLSQLLNISHIKKAKQAGMATSNIIAMEGMMELLISGLIGIFSSIAKSNL
jgi:hypothetical protein